MKLNTAYFIVSYVLGFTSAALITHGLGWVAGLLLTAWVIGSIIVCARQ